MPGVKEFLLTCIFLFEIPKFKTSFISFDFVMCKMIKKFNFQYNDGSNFSENTNLDFLNQCSPLGQVIIHNYLVVPSICWLKSARKVGFKYGCSDFFISLRQKYLFLSKNFCYRTLRFFFLSFSIWINIIWKNSF